MEGSLVTGIDEDLRRLLVVVRSSHELELYDVEHGLHESKDSGAEGV